MDRLRRLRQTRAAVPITTEAQETGAAVPTPAETQETEESVPMVRVPMVQETIPEITAAVPPEAAVPGQPEPATQTRFFSTAD